jgi:pyrroloquinoline-quinone synthase
VTLGEQCASAPLTGEGLAAALRDHDVLYHDHHPFHLRMNAGQLSHEELQRWVVNRFYYQSSIPLKDAAIISNCPHGEIRRAWLPRIVDHDGVDGDTGGIASWRRLAEALGVQPDRLTDVHEVLPGVRFAVDAYVRFCQKRPWIEAVASSLTELFGPRAIAVRVDALARHYPWIEPSGLDYFRRRLTLAPRDAEYALTLVVDRCRQRDEQERAIAALRFKCDVLWAQLDAIERGDTRPS